MQLRDAMKRGDRTTVTETAKLSLIRAYQNQVKPFGLGRYK